MVWTSRSFRKMEITSQWHHNERDGVSDHQPHDCLLNRLFRRRSKKISKLRRPVNSPYKGLVKRIMFPFDDVITQLCTRRSWFSGNEALSNGCRVVQYLRVLSCMAWIPQMFHEQAMQFWRRSMMFLCDINEKNENVVYIQRTAISGDVLKIMKICHA